MRASGLGVHRCMATRNVFRFSQRQKTQLNKLLASGKRTDSLARTNALQLHFPEAFNNYQKRPLLNHVFVLYHDPHQCAREMPCKDYPKSLHSFNRLSSWLKQGQWMFCYSIEAWGAILLERAEAGSKKCTGRGPIQTCPFVLFFFV